ncbi:MAG: HAD hydrolase family protein, partial [Lysobacterales bacterium]
MTPDPGASALPVVSKSPDFPPDVIERALRIRLACFDVDGVLTDGRLWYGADGESLKAFHVHDGLGLRMLGAAGIEVAIVTARRSAAVTARMADLGIERVYQGVADKLACVTTLAGELTYQLEEVAFTGDDQPDADAMCSVGLAIAVANARPEILALAQYCTRAAGGVGAVREVCDLLLFANALAAAAID